MAAIRLPRKLNRTRINLLLDIGLALAYVVDSEERFVGLRNHELIGLALGAALLIHLLLHGRWVISITRTFFRKLLHESRLNYVLVLALLLDMGVTIVTGILISRTLGLSFHVENLGGLSLERIHTFTADLSLLLVALHVAMHWKWIATNAKKYLFSIRFPRRKTAVPTIAPSSHRTMTPSEV